MNRHVKRLPVRLGAIAGAASLACLGALQVGTSPGAGAAASHAKAHATGTVHVAKVSGKQVLVTSSGMTLYVFGRDHHKTPTCTGSCAAVWRPLIVGRKPVAGHGAKKAMLGTVRTKNGKRQVTYDHWPLYTFSGDTAPGQRRGQGLESFGGKWSTISAAGKSLVSVTSSSKHSSSSGSGSGSGAGW